MPKRTRRSSKISAKPKKACCGLKVKLTKTKDSVRLKFTGKKVNGSLHLVGDPDCEELARLSYEVALNDCLLMGTHTVEYCEEQADIVYHQVYDECIS